MLWPYTGCPIESRVIPSIEGTPDSKVHGANMGPIWGRQDPGEPHEPCRQDPGGPHVDPLDLAIWDIIWDTSTRPNSYIWRLCTVYIYYS